MQQVRTKKTTIKELRGDKRYGYPLRATLGYTPNTLRNWDSELSSTGSMMCVRQTLKFGKTLFLILFQQQSSYIRLTKTKICSILRMCITYQEKKFHCNLFSFVKRLETLAGQQLYFMHCVTTKTLLRIKEVLLKIHFQTLS